MVAQLPLEEFVMVRIHVGQPIPPPQNPIMQFEEKQIVDFLKPLPGTFYSVTEIGRKAGSRKQFHDNPNWPRPYLVSLVGQGYLDSNFLGQYCYKEPHSKKKRRYKIGGHLELLTPEEVAPPTSPPSVPPVGGAAESSSPPTALKSGPGRQENQPPAPIPIKTPGSNC
jgi:hypothetical protein